MTHDECETLALARFHARIDRLVNEVELMDHDDVAQTPPAPEAGGFLDIADPNAINEAMEAPLGEHYLDEGYPEEAKAGRHAVPAGTTTAPGELEWSWRPDAQPKDPGRVFTAEELAVVNAGGYVPPLPWMVEAYSGKDLKPRPTRIRSIR